MRTLKKQINNLRIYEKNKTIKQIPQAIYLVITPDGRVLEEFVGVKDGRKPLERAEEFCKNTTDFITRRSA